jgi:hypothetical protein
MPSASTAREELQELQTELRRRGVWGDNKEAPAEARTAPDADGSARNVPLRDDAADAMMQDFKRQIPEKLKERKP